LEQVLAGTSSHFYHSQVKSPNDWREAASIVGERWRALASRADRWRLRASVVCVWKREEANGSGKLVAEVGGCGRPSVQRAALYGGRWQRSSVAMKSGGRRLAPAHSDEQWRAAVTVLDILLP
jgi:hypothetical protein